MYCCLTSSELLVSTMPSCSTKASSSTDTHHWRLGQRLQLGQPHEAQATAAGLLFRLKAASRALMSSPVSFSVCILTEVQDGVEKQKNRPSGSIGIPAKTLVGRVKIGGLDTLSGAPPACSIYWKELKK